MRENVKKGASGARSAKNNFEHKIVYGDGNL